jgi:lysozyme family protein/peptidoglycan hydrolase-like protein with peptidoglycan-binding domain
MNLTSAVKAEYDRLWDTCEIRADKRASAAAIADRVVAHRDRYEAAAGPLGIPWYFVGIVHQLESSGDFTRHLHNGDPLTARTVQEPSGRPTTGHPPFTWEFSAKDALVGDGLASWHDWSISGMLFRFETFNGFGYRKPEINIPTPYLWSFSNHYTKGKYVRDRVYDPNAVSAQCGTAVLLRLLADRGLVEGGLLERGNRGPAVVALKADLKKWFDGHAPAEWQRLDIADGDLFGAALENAVKFFQERKHLPQTGKADGRTQAKLAAAIAGPITPPAPAILQAGDNHPAVRKLKRDLKAWFDANVPGEWATFGIVAGDHFGAGLEKAVRDFQTRNHLEVDGQVGQQTRDALAAAVPA